jgi:hypothetical protein
LRAGFERGPRRWGAAALAVVVLGAPAFPATAHADTPARPSAPRAATPVSTPSWWSGDCDAGWWNKQAAAAGWHGAGAHRLGASYLGVPVCGPRPAVDNAPDVLWRRPGWGELEFECVELAMRFMAQIYGVNPYNANGNTVVKNYTAADGGNLVKVGNGTTGRAPQPGDVISFNSPGLGHVGVVTASDVDAGGNGQITMLSQNDTANGWRTLAVTDWKVASFGDQTPYGWLHDPAGRGGAPTAVAPGGYWMLAASGAVYAFGTVASYGPAPGPAVAIATPPTAGGGYWVTDRTGRVTAFGHAHVYGHPPALRAGERVAAISATPSGLGYWLFTSCGRAFAYGDAHFYGDMSKATLNGPVIASVATPTGHGYYMIGSDGGVFTFGDARFHGSTGNLRLQKPVIGIAPTPDNRGYWLVASDGGIFSFNAPFRGSMGGTRLDQPVTGAVAFGDGYLMVGAAGAVYDFSDKPYYGSLTAKHAAATILALAVSAG